MTTRKWVFLLALLPFAVSAVSAADLYLCVKKNPKSGNPNPSSPVRVKAACANNEIQLDPVALGLEASTAASLGFQKVATYGEVDITNVKVNGVSIAQAVAPGAAFSLSFVYFIKDTACPSCIDQIQIGFADQNPVVCGYDDVPGASGDGGTANLLLTAPSVAGTYYVGFDRAQAFVCPNAWWNSAPGPQRFIAVIAVQ